MIPGSMWTRSYIVVGKEHPMSFHSRLMAPDDDPRGPKPGRSSAWTT